MSNSWDSIFYDTNIMSLDDKKKLLEDAHKVAIKWWVDKLTPKNLHRQKIDMSFIDILEKLDAEKSYYVVIERNYPCKHGEIGFCSSFVNESFYLFIQVSSENLEKIVKRYNLHKRAL